VLLELDNHVLEFDLVESSDIRFCASVIAAGLEHRL
jgi:hypothetical protein